MITDGFICLSKCIIVYYLQSLVIVALQVLVDEYILIGNAYSNEDNSTEWCLVISQTGLWHSTF